MAAAVLGREDYTRAELDHARTLLAAQLDTVKALRTAVERDGSGEGVAALAAFEAGFYNALLLVLDRLFVDRPRAAAGKDAGPLDEVDLIVESLLHHGGVLRPGPAPARSRSVTGLAAGDHIRLTRDGFEQLSAAFLAELERRLPGAP